MSERTPEPTMREIARGLKANGMRCNCDLDNWEPEVSTGHSWVCRIHKAALKLKGRKHSVKGNPS